MAAKVLWGLLHLGWILCGKQAQPYPFHSTAELHGFKLVLRAKVTPTCQSTPVRLEEKSLNRNKILKIFTSHYWMWSFSCCLVYSCVLNSWEEKKWQSCELLRQEAHPWDQTLLTSIFFSGNSDVWLGWGSFPCPFAGWWAPPCTFQYVQCKNSESLLNIVK